MAIRRCPYCKAIIDESQKYCNNCGTQLLFPEDDLNEEPVKGEKILDEDFKDEDENKGFDQPSDDLGIEREEIDLEAVLKGSGHFPDEPASSRPSPPAPRAADAPPTPSLPPEAPEPAAVRRPSRPRKKSDPAAPKNDTREEIARLIAALEEKEKKGAEPPEPPVRDHAPGPEPETIIPPQAALSRPEAEPRDESFEIPAKKPASEPPSWETLLKKPATADLENGPLPSAFTTVEEIEPGESSAIEGPPANATAGDTMDFEEELFRRTPKPAASSTRMGIPEGVTGGSAILPRLDEEEELPRKEIRRPLFGEEIPAAVPDDSGSFEEEETTARRLGFFRKIAALFFDVLFIGGVCLASLWLAARLMDVALFDLVSAARVSVGLYFLALLFGYFFLFLFFLGETLGGRMASPRS